METVVFFNLPAYGHIRVTLPVVQHLVRRGIRVLYYMHESYLPLIAETGAEVRTLPNCIPTSSTPRNMLEAAYWGVEQALQSIPALIEELPAENPRLIVHDSVCPWGRFIARILEVPTARTCGVFLGVASPARKMPPVSILLKALPALPSYLRFSRTAKTLHRDYGLQDLKVADVLKNIGDLNIVFTAREFLPNSESLDDSYRFVGTALFDNETSALPDNDSDKQPLIYISLGTIFNDMSAFYKTCKSAFESVDALIVLSVGKQVNPEDLGPWPNNFRVAQFVPQIEILKSASIFVSHAGGCSVMESLYHGVPLVMIPKTADHAFNAACVVRRRAGVLLGKGDLSAERIREATLEILKIDDYRSSAIAMGETLRASGGAEPAADEIIAFFRGGAIRSTVT